VHVSQYNRLVARVQAKEAQLTKYQTLLDGLIDGNSAKVSSFEFNSGEADQRAKLRNPEDVQKVITRLEKEIDLLYRKLNGITNSRFVSNRRW